jgi:hypothetical protein
MKQERYTKEGLPILKSKVLERVGKEIMKDSGIMPLKIKDWFKEILNENYLLAEYILKSSERENRLNLVAYEGMIVLYKLLKNQAEEYNSEKNFYNLLENLSL